MKGQRLSRQGRYRQRSPRLRAVREQVRQRSALGCSQPRAPEAASLWASTGTRTRPIPIASTLTSSLPAHREHHAGEDPERLADHGNGAPTIKGTYEESHAIMAKLAELGIDFKSCHRQAGSRRRRFLHQVLGFRPH